jgi:hypothetical protein
MAVGKGEYRMKSGVTHVLRNAAPQGLVLAVAIASLSGCMGSPTYGTDKPADRQLLEDITGVLSLAPKNDQRIEYKPRPELVKPASLTTLPPPQDSVITASNPDWPESPEQRRARVRAEATANRDNLDFSPEVVDTRTGTAPAVTRNARGDVVDTFNGNGKQTREEFNRRIAENKQGSATSRRYLSEPPTEYRKPVETAPVGDVGEEEWRKEQRRKAAAGGGSTFSWRDLVPGF